MINKLCWRCKESYKVTLKFGEVEKTKKQLCTLCANEFQAAVRNILSSAENMEGLIESCPGIPESPLTSVEQLKKKINEKTRFYLKENGQKFLKRSMGFKKSILKYKKWEIQRTKEKNKLMESHYLLLRDFKLNIVPDPDPAYPDARKKFGEWLDQVLAADYEDWFRKLKLIINSAK